MKPTLFEVFGETVPAYFAMLMVGFGLAIFLAQRQARRMGLDHDTMIDLGLYALLWGVIGGRLLHVVADGLFWDYVHLCTDPSLVEWDLSVEQCASRGGIWDTGSNTCHPAERDCFAWLKFWNGGLAFYGGLIAASAFGIHFLRKEGFPLWKGVDLVGMTMPLGLFFGRMGCFLGGCCFGQPVDEGFALAVRFPGRSDASQEQHEHGLLPDPGAVSLPVHPTQLYEAAGCLAIAAFLMLVWRPRKRFDGQLMLLFLGLYAVLRFAIEYLRADDRGALLGLSTSQLIGLGVLAVAAWGWRRLSPKAA